MKNSFYFKNLQKFSVKSVKVSYVKKLTNINFDPKSREINFTKT